MMVKGRDGFAPLFDCPEAIRKRKCGGDSGEYLAEDFGRAHGAYGGIVEAEVAQCGIKNGVALSV